MRVKWIVGFYANGALKLFGQVDETGMDLSDAGNSPPSSFRVGTVGTPLVSRGLEHTIDPSKRHALCRIAFIIDQTPAAGVTTDVDILKFLTNANGLNGIKVTLAKIPGPNVEVQLRRDGSGELLSLLSTLPNIWHSLLFELHFKPVNNDAGLEVTAGMLGQLKGRSYLAAMGTPGLLGFRFGLMAATDTWRVRYDDVACTIY